MEDLIFDRREEGYDPLQKLLEMPRMQLVELGKKSRAYVERWHDPLKIAADFKRDYEAALSRPRG